MEEWENGGKLYNEGKLKKIIQLKKMKENYLIE
jgi:hypothetical protein